ncbi:hypothetical protein N7478_012614 [Penicillium angulare]|uniref:uncharacterized protein n=1 Tax=Penicillium angulare TaxID=116970 RepID=UPI0025418FFC|nr:uncharacterized protein N7478_012614 [Penicillium angulare]KAJ5259633.1 hypothetical protein N7478_012614 [Penicillium angulare]
MPEVAIEPAKFMINKFNSINRSLLYQIGDIATERYGQRTKIVRPCTVPSSGTSTLAAGHEGILPAGHGPYAACNGIGDGPWSFVDLGRRPCPFIRETVGVVQTNGTEHGRY